MRNKVLPGEEVWGAGQILAMFLVLIPLLGCIKIFIKEVGDRNHWARRWFKVDIYLTITIKTNRMVL